MSFYVFYLTQIAMDIGYMKKMDLMDVASMRNTTKATMKFLQMYEEQKSMPDHNNMSVMEMSIGM